MTLPNPDDKVCIVYTTLQPDVRLTVTEAERDELAAQGLIHKEGRAKDGETLPDKTHDQG